MNQLISLKSLLFMLFTLFGGLFYNVHQKEEKSSSKENESFVKVANIKKIQNNGKAFASPVSNGCGKQLGLTKTVAVRATSRQGAEIAAHREFISWGCQQCGESSGSCDAGLTCGFQMTRFEVTDIAWVAPNKYWVTASADGQCSCIDPTVQ